MAWPNPELGLSGWALWNYKAGSADTDRDEELACLLQPITLPWTSWVPGQFQLGILWLIHSWGSQPVVNVGTNTDTGLSRFSKVQFMKDLHENLFSLTERNPKRIFTFTIKKKKRHKAKIVLSIGFALSFRDSMHPKQRQRHLPQEWHSASQHQAAIASLFYLDLFCASVSKMCPKIIASSLNVVSAYERSHRYPLLSARKSVLLRGSKIEVRKLALRT